MCPGSGDENDVGERLDDLEAADAKRRESQRLDRKFELYEVIVMSIAAVLAAWAGFQAAKWSGVQANSYSRAGASRVESSRLSVQAGQQSTIDTLAFTQWLEALKEEGLFRQASQQGQAYEPDPSALSGFLFERFPPDLKTAVDAWLATDPWTDADAPATPFAMPQYRVKLSELAARAERNGEAHAAEAREANQRSDDYILVTILLAAVLFFAGVSSKMDTLRARVILLGTATALLVVAMAIVATFPKEV